MALNFFYNLVFAGIIQGCFFSLLILSSRQHRTKSSIYLGFLILSITLTNLQFTADELGWVSWHTFNLIYFPYLFLLAPLLYFFVITFLYPERKIKPIERLLYVPFLFLVAATLFYKINFLLTGKSIENNQIQADLADDIDKYADFINIPIILLTIILLIVTISNYKKTPQNIRSQIIRSQLIWLQLFLGVLLCSLIPWLIYTYKYWKNENTIYLPIFIITSFIIYTFGYIGIYKIKILNQRTKIRETSHRKISYIIEDRSKAQNEHIISLKKILVNEKRFLDPNLSLDMLAEELQLSKSHLSRIINSELSSNFSEYINILRVEEAKAHLQNPEFSNYTLLAIGLEAGFNSKTTFNTSFKKITGTTPSAFRKSLPN